MSSAPAVESTNSRKRFASYTPQEIEQKKKLLTPPNTVKADICAATTFRAYLTEKEMRTDFETFSTEDLDKALESFYVEARTKTGELYKRCSLDAFRYTNP